VPSKRGEMDPEQVNTSRREPKRKGKKPQRCGIGSLSPFVPSADRKEGGTEGKKKICNPDPSKGPRQGYKRTPQAKEPELYTTMHRHYPEGKSRQEGKKKVGPEEDRARSSQ